MNKQETVAKLKILLPDRQLPDDWRSPLDLCGVDLRRIVLAGAYLGYANLTCANLAEADLTCANLTGANLSGARLRGVDFFGADLTWTDLTGANLFRADLRRTNLDGAILNWNSHDLMAELLMREAKTIEQRKVASLVLTGKRFYMCWNEFLSQLPKDDLEWGLKVLADAVSPNDPNIPKIVQKYMEKKTWKAWDEQTRNSSQIKDSAAGSSTVVKSYMKE